MEKNISVIIDKEKCVGCGLCKSDCVGCDIEIVDGKPKAVTTLVIGYPAVKYHRTPHRKLLNVIKA